MTLKYNHDAMLHIKLLLDQLATLTCLSSLMDVQCHHIHIYLVVLPHHW